MLPDSIGVCTFLFFFFTVLQLCRDGSSLMVVMQMVSVHRNANECCTGKILLNFCPVAEIIFASISKLTAAFLTVSVCTCDSPLNWVLRHTSSRS